MKVTQTLMRRGFPLVAKRAAFHSATFRATSLVRSNVPCLATSLSHQRFFSSKSLVDILAREANEEKESGNLSMPEELETLKALVEKNWKIVEDGATTNLFLKDKKVQISFHCQDTVEENFFEEESNDEEAEEPVNSVQFCVTVSKAGKTLVLNCISEYGEARIESVLTSSTTPEAVHANQGNLPERAQYQGPEFTELAEDLQEAFTAYLESECGVNSDVASFIAMFSDYREQQQYVQFLKDTQSIIS
jgi:complement component 1 Q subcomponent-binding protein